MKLGKFSPSPLFGRMGAPLPSTVCWMSGVLPAENEAAVASAIDVVYADRKILLFLDENKWFFEAVPECKDPAGRPDLFYWFHRFFLPHFVNTDSAVGSALVSISSFGTLTDSPLEPGQFCTLA